MKPRLVLSLPVRRARPRGVVRDDPGRLQPWLARLEGADPRSRLNALGEALATLNRVDLPIRRRSRLLESFRVALADCLETPDAEIPGPERLQAALELAYGAKIVVAEMFARDSGLGAARNARGLQRSIWAMGVLARESVVAASPAPQRLWRELHELYDCAVRMGVDERVVDDPVAEPKTPARASLEYRRALLFGLCADALRNTEDVHETWRFLGRIASLARLRWAQPGSADDCCFLVDPKADSPARHRGAGPAAESPADIASEPCLELDARRVVRFLHNKLDNAAEAERTSGVEAAPPGVARALILSWSGGSGAPPPSIGPPETDQVVPMPETPLAAPTGVVRLRRGPRVSAPPREPAQRNPSPARDGAAGGSAGPVAAAPTATDGGGPRAPDNLTAPPTAPSRTPPQSTPTAQPAPDHPPATHWLTRGLDSAFDILASPGRVSAARIDGWLRDQREHGARLDVAAADADAMPVGAVVLCAPVGANGEHWLGVIRRRRDIGHGRIELGAQVLTRRPRLARLHTADDDRERHAVLIDGHPRTGRPPTLLAPPRTLSAGQRFDATIGQRSVALLATDVLEHTGELQWLGCRRLPKQAPG